MGKVFGLGRAVALLGLVALTALTACAPVYRSHGYTPADDELALIEVGSSTRADVAAAVGEPTAEGLLADSGWYYVQSRFRHFTYNAPEEVDREVVAISFNDAGVVTNVERFGLERGRVVALSRRVTSTNVQGVSFLRQLFRNIGRVDPTAIFAEGF